MDGSQLPLFDRPPAHQSSAIGVPIDGSEASHRAGLNSRDQSAGHGGDRPRVLYVDHSSKIAGAELVLLDVIEGELASSAVFLFQDGPLVEAIQARGVAHMISAHAGDLSAIRRDGGLLRALPRIAGLLGALREIAGAASTRDIIYANSQKAFVLAAFARLIARRPLVWHLHDILDRSHFGAAQIRLVVTLANRLACRVIVPSQATGDAFAAAGGTASLIHVVPNGVDVVRPAEPAAALREILGLPAGFLFGVFSRLAHWKGQHIAIEAAALAPGAHCVIVGDAQFGEHDYASSLRELAVRLGVADRVHFLGHRTDVARLMSAVDAVVHPSVDPEPFGRTLVEAMALGVPVIATDRGAARDILDGGSCGRLVPPANASEIAEALRSARDEAGIWSTITAAATSRAGLLYNAARMRAAIRAILAGVPKRSPR